MNIKALILVAILTWLAFHNWSIARDQESDKPNIIFILADDLGYGEVGFNGQEKILTPELDEMARQGLVFNHHYAGAAVCGPSRCALMTGKSQAIGFIKDNPGYMWQRENLPDNDITIAEKMKEAGYKTACLGKWGLGPQGKSGYPLNQGFDEFVGYDTHIAAHNYYPKELCKNEGMLQLRGNAGVRKKEVGKTYSHDIFTESALEIVKRKHQKPFFLYLAYTIPHSPFNPPDNGPYANKPWTDIQKQYAAMITRMDRDIGKILKALRDQGIAENTLVAFSSDNGTNAPGSKPAGDDFFRASGPFRGKKTTVFEGGIRVPTVFLWPGRIEAGRTDHTSGFQDIMPTLCELTGVRSPKNIDGISLLPILTGKTGKQKQHDYFYWEFCSMGAEGVSNGIQAVLDVKNNLKAIRRGRNAKLQLYNIRNDPEESEDLADYHPGQVKELDEKINSLRGSSDLWPVTFFDYPEKKVRYDELIEEWASLKSSL